MINETRSAKGTAPATPAGTGLFRCGSGESLASAWTADTSAGCSPCARKYMAGLGGGGGGGEAAPRATTTTNWLRPLMAFQGYQISGYKKYQVHVLLQTVALPAEGCAAATTPHVTGFLTIRGLTNQHPEITTFFESFAVNDTVGFLSSSMPPELAEYKSSDRVDLEHWLNFPSFKELCMAGGGTTVADIMDGHYTHRDYLARRFVFMRWKEKFLVPDEEVGAVEGASYDGYYYIVHDQVTGSVLGFYYHKDAEKFQQLELTPVYPDRQGVCCFEFA
ncbi:ADL330Wp [Eremothecium gossypii ATCC 10895]|uniref:ADL330Wp n=1 Tax=Eremothecium gossypii (strain ATCC 10895 / CBS 109.51 / FGSC 9923 / NRRL Y-1056) TaxID=284811 RepID=Q75B96_EREGS|nr:ADL330Wp [Eremothecium gossypii ATCC 10895]AAS51590.2 ADL330Wp [Eremothecium gossypii ATCC 10895]AEY95886.1 FADL330Wp [Eremothecium gossypii FDAG1]